MKINKLINEPQTIITSDIETILITDKEKTYHLPIVISITTKYISKTFSIKNINKDTIINESQKMCSEFIKYLTIYGDLKNYIYFHNMSNFDGYFFIKTLIQNQIIPKIQNRFNKIIYFEFTQNNKYFKVYDSYLMIPYSLKKACEIYNTTLGKTEFDFSNFNIETITLEKLNILKEYCQNDSNSLYQLIINFNNLLLINFNTPIYQSPTLASYSYKLYLNQYYNYNFNYLKNQENDFIRMAYYGGIADVYKPHGIDIIGLDINSSYPNVMKNNLYPIDSPNFTNEKFTSIEQALQKYPNSFIKCLITCSENNYYPILPYKEDKKSKLIQPVGNWVGVYWSEEIRYALSTKYYEIQPISLYYYNDMQPIFKDYITDLYKRRLEYAKKNDLPNELLMKKLMNSLYGRTAILPNETRIKIQSIEEYYDSTDSIIDYSTLGHDTIMTFQKINNIEEQNNINLKILKVRSDWAAIVTSLARINIHKIITTPGINTYYTDTDSIFLDKKDLHILKDVISSEIGDLKIITSLEEKTEGIFLAPKTYILKNKEIIIKMKSIPIDTIPNNELYPKFLNKLKQFQEEKIIIKNQTKNFQKNIKTLNIEQKIIKKSVYTLEHNKRIKIFDKNNTWIDTKPIKISPQKNILNTKPKKIKDLIKQKNENNLN